MRAYDHVTTGSLAFKSKASIASINHTRHTNSPIRRESPEASNDGQANNASLAKKSSKSIIIS